MYIDDLKTSYSIKPNATTIEEAQQYAAYRSKQFLKFGYKLIKHHPLKNVGIVTYYKSFDESDKTIYGTIYLLDQVNTEELYKRLVEWFGITCVLTLCSFSKEIPCKLLKHSKSYDIAKVFYGDRKAKRSKVPLIYHLDEGGGILEMLGATDDAKDAFYLHPLIQSTEEFNKLLLNGGINDLPNKALALAVEYRNLANSYLSYVKDYKRTFAFKNKDSMLEEVRMMLVADKVQNYKDFLLYHEGKHVRSHELNIYFNNWFEMLDVDYHDIYSKVF